MSAQNPQVVDPQEFIPLLDYEFSGDDSTVESKRRFIEAYRNEGSIYHAAQIARIHRTTVYKWLERDPVFVTALDDSREDTYDQVETSVFRKAVNGDTLSAIFYLKAHRPKFRDKVTVDLDDLREQIQQKIGKLDVDRLRQLPVASTQFIDTETVQGRSDTAQSLHFPPPSPDLQKDSTNE